MIGFFGFIAATLALWLALQRQVSLSEAESGSSHHHAED
jgi:hypothetical protein